MRFKNDKILKFWQDAQTLRCPDDKQDAQTSNEMPRRQTRCQDAQADKMPRQTRWTRCPDVKQDAQTSNKMPRRQTRCPEVDQDAQKSNKMPRSFYLVGHLVRLGISSDWGSKFISFDCKEHEKQNLVNFWKFQNFRIFKTPLYQEDFILKSNVSTVFLDQRKVD